MSNCPNEIKNRAQCHSERKLINELEKREDLTGANIDATGQFPPCPNCHRALQKLAKQKGVGSINYKWNDADGEHSITYHGEGASPVPKAGDAKSEALASNYAMTEDKTNPDLGCKFNSWRTEGADGGPATGALPTYQQQRDDAKAHQKSQKDQGQ